MTAIWPFALDAVLQGCFLVPSATCATALQCDLQRTASDLQAVAPNECNVYALYRGLQTLQ